MVQHAQQWLSLTTIAFCIIGFNAYVVHAWTFLTLKISQASLAAPGLVMVTSIVRDATLRRFRLRLIGCLFWHQCSYVISFRLVSELTALFLNYSLQATDYSGQEKREKKKARGQCWTALVHSCHGILLDFVIHRLLKGFRL